MKTPHDSPWRDASIAVRSQKQGRHRLCSGSGSQSFTLTFSPFLLVWVRSKTRKVWSTAYSYTWFLLETKWPPPNCFQICSEELKPLRCQPGNLQGIQILSPSMAWNHSFQQSIISLPHPHSIPIPARQLKRHHRPTSCGALSADFMEP